MELMMASADCAMIRHTMLTSTRVCARSVGRMKRRPIRISIPQGSSRASGKATASGSTPTAMRPPSSGGSGNKLNTARTNIDDQCVFEILCDPWRCRFWQVIDQVKSECGENGERNVHGRSSRKGVMLLSYLVLEAIARREKPIVNQPVERA